MVNFLDKYFYSVELNEDNKKVIHLDCSYYKRCDGLDYARIDYTHAYIPIGSDRESIDTVADEVTQYQFDMNEDEFRMDFNDHIKQAKYLPLTEVVNETPCGYYFECKKQI